jgi:Leucine-rich repeat (LRR) protein
MHNLPSRVFDLKSLTFLSLSNNALTEIPLSITRLVNLENVVLERNKISHVPKEIFSLKKLKNLDLFGNFIDVLPEEVLDAKNRINIILGDNDLIHVPSQMAFNMFVNITIDSYLNPHLKERCNNPTHVPTQKALTIDKYPKPHLRKRCNNPTHVPIQTALTPCENTEPDSLGWCDSPRYRGVKFTHQTQDSMFFDVLWNTFSHILFDREVKHIIRLMFLETKRKTYEGRRSLLQRISVDIIKDILYFFQTERVIPK